MFNHQFSVYLVSAAAAAEFSVTQAPVVDSHLSAAATAALEAVVAEETALAEV